MTLTFDPLAWSDEKDQLSCQIWSLYDEWFTRYSAEKKMFIIKPCEFEFDPMTLKSLYRSSIDQTVKPSNQIHLKSLWGVVYMRWEKTFLFFTHTSFTFDPLTLWLLKQTKHPSSMKSLWWVLHNIFQAEKMALLSLATLIYLTPQKTSWIFNWSWPVKCGISVTNGLQIIVRLSE